MIHRPLAFFCQSSGQRVEVDGRPDWDAPSSGALSEDASSASVSLSL